MVNKVTQKNNKVQDGDIVGGDKFEIENVFIEREEPTVKRKKIIRKELNFDLDSDDRNTTLLKKLRDGELNETYIEHAIKTKLDSLNIFITLSKSPTGKGLLADLYSDLNSIINSNIMSMDKDDLLKSKIGEIRSEFEKLRYKFQNLIEIDDSILFGLLFIATSNCAIRWKIK